MDESGDILITEFMGHKVIDDSITRHFYFNSDKYKSNNLRGPKCVCNVNVFSKYWEFLIPVVQEIKSKYVHNTILNNLDDYSDWIAIIDNQLAKLDFVSLHKVVVKFIEWYNKNKA